MNRNVIFGLAILGAVILVGAGVWLYNWVLGEPLAASEPISATPIVVEAQLPTSAPQTLEATAAPAADAPAEDVSTPDESASGVPAGFVVLSIVSAESEARFNIYELLNGADKDVIGVTNQIAGEVAINPADLSQAQFGPIQVNARTFVTDDDRRNNAIRNRILFTNDYEFITFVPTSVTGLSGAGAVGQTYSFQVTGDLTIRDVTQPVTFNVTLQAESDTRVTGSAAATIKRSDFGIAIPSVPFVANVADEFSLEIDLVLAPVAR